MFFFFKDPNFMYVETSFSGFHLNHFYSHPYYFFFYLIFILLATILFSFHISYYIFHVIYFLSLCMLLNFLCNLFFEPCISEIVYVLLFIFKVLFCSHMGLSFSLWNKGVIEKQSQWKEITHLINWSQNILLSQMLSKRWPREHITGTSAQMWNRPLMGGTLKLPILLALQWLHLWWQLDASNILRALHPLSYLKLHLIPKQQIFKKNSIIIYILSWGKWDYKRQILSGKLNIWMQYLFTSKSMFP